ncbi:HDOD domain-containing protein [Thioalkalivibrio sp. ALJ16]|uniref:HDOD domain-containing protein n=1 Tax=Thioalkalivibrio sp. ALJ16 TaxID=1158762 RepID=UPI0003756745|nr:HDOD domain-containing protein [Thioalkalivibrio sp. ALJ16]
MDSTRIDALLKDMDLTSSLSDQARSELASACTARELEAGRRMRPQDVDDRYLFLVQGQLVRVSGGSPARISVDAADPESPMQMFDNNSGQQDFIITEKPCQILEVPTAALERAHSASLVVHDTDLDDTEGAFFGELYDLITSNRLELPTMPEIALRIQELTNDPDADLDKLTEVIQRDGTIAGALLHATNSPLFRASKQIQSVRDAVNRLGFRNTRMLAMNMALRQAFKARHASTREAMEQSWKHGALQSAYSYLIADSLKQLDRERALLAGLVAGIGAVPIIQFVELREAQPDTERVQSLVRRLSNLAGVLVINYWDLGSDLVTVAEHAGDWGYRANAPDYASMALVAEWAARRAEGESVPEASEVAAFEVLGITQPSAGEPIAFLEERTEDLAELRAMFNV